VARGDSGSRSPFQSSSGGGMQPLSFSVLIFAFVRCEIKSQGVYIVIFMSNPRRWHED
jgi:hypothetical protein